MGRLADGGYVYSLSGKGGASVLIVWLDKQGRMRRMNLTMNIKAHTLHESMDLYDFGTREAVKAPPASETTDVTQLAARQSPSG